MLIISKWELLKGLIGNELALWQLRGKQRRVTQQLYDLQQLRIINSIVSYNFQTCFENNRHAVRVSPKSCRIQAEPELLSGTVSFMFRDPFPHLALCWCMTSCQFCFFSISVFLKLCNFSILKAIHFCLLCHASTSTLCCRSAVHLTPTHIVQKSTIQLTFLLQACSTCLN